MTLRMWGKSVESEGIYCPTSARRREEFIYSPKIDRALYCGVDNLVYRT